MRIGCLINARLASKRLPKKHLRDVGGKTVLERLIDRIEHVKNNNVQIIIATGTEHENKSFEAIAKHRGIDIFYGDPNNIPQRHLDCARKHNLDAIISLDADDVLVSPSAILATIVVLRGGAALHRTEGLPIGLNVLWAYTVEKLAESLKTKGTGSYDTCWGWIFSSPLIAKFDIKDADKIRATLDFPEDLHFLRAVYAECPASIMGDDVKLCKWLIESRVYRVNRKRHIPLANKESIG